MGGVIQALRLLLLLNGLNEINTNWKENKLVVLSPNFTKKDALENINLYVLVS